MEEELIKTPSPLADFNRRTFIGTIVAGITAGVLTFVLSRVLEIYIMTPALCSDDGAAICQNVPVISFHLASILAGVVAVVILVNSSVYRPLLVAIAAVIGLWQSSILISDIPWPTALGALVILNTLAYLSFTWLLRIYNFVFAIIPVIAVAAGLFAAFHFA